MVRIAFTCALLFTSACGSVDGTTAGTLSSSFGDASSGEQGSEDPDAMPLKAGSRLFPNLWTASDGATYQDGTFWDTKYNQDCAVSLSDDGNMRCLPLATARSVGGFSDSLCTKHLVSISSFISSSKGCSRPSNGTQAVLLSDPSNFLAATGSVSREQFCPFSLAGPIVSLGERITGDWYQIDPNTQNCIQGSGNIPVTNSKFGTGFYTFEVTNNIATNTFQLFSVSQNE